MQPHPEKGVGDFEDWGRFGIETGALAGGCAARLAWTWLKLSVQSDAVSSRQISLYRFRDSTEMFAVLWTQ